MKMHGMSDFICYIDDNELCYRPELELDPVGTTTHLVQAQFCTLPFSYIVTITKHFVVDKFRL